MHTLFWLEDLKGRDHSEDVCTKGREILEQILGIFASIKLETSSFGSVYLKKRIVFT
jgi:hypothetical protein